MEINETPTLLLALASAAVLAVLHLAAPHIRRLPFVPEHVTTSFAGGIAVAYAFLHLLPELIEGNERLREVLGEEGGRTPLFGLEIFLVALGGFLVFYGLARLGERHGDHATRGPGVFRLHLGAFCVYNGIIGYSLPLNWRVSVPFAVLFTVAMGLHFVLTDRALEEHYGDRFDRRPPRVLLATALLAGWAVAALVAPTSGVWVSVLTAFLAGSILFNVFREEIPSTRGSHFGWFTLGLGGYALLLVLATVAAESAGEADAAAAAGVRTPAGSTTPCPGADRVCRGHV